MKMQNKCIGTLHLLKKGIPGKIERALFEVGDFQSKSARVARSVNTNFFFVP